MKLNGSILAVGLSAMILCACGSSQNATVMPGTVSQSRMHQRSGSPSLIYATGGCGGACVLSFPDGQLVDSIAINGIVSGACSDSKGNVFISNDSQVQEYAHGGTAPAASLSLPGNEAWGCSIDPKTGNLAVVFSGSGSDVAIFTAAQGSPALYQTHAVSEYCGYDNHGNLFVSGYSGSHSELAELPKGASDFQPLSISGDVGGSGQVQWDGRYVTYESRSSGDIKISRLMISGSSATVIGTTHFKGDLRNAYQSWIYGKRILIPFSINGQEVNKIGLWAYPKGGKPIAKFAHISSTFTKFAGLTVSVAPTASHSRK